MYMNGGVFYRKHRLLDVHKQIHQDSAPHSDPEHPNSIQIQYWTPTTTQFVDAIIYEGWDSSSGNSWHEDSRYDLI